MKLRLTSCFACCIFFSVTACLAQQAPLTTGTVRYTMTNKSAKDTAIQTVYFKPGKGAFTIINAQDSTGYHSVFDFKQDSVFHVFLMDGQVVRVMPMKISSTLTMSRLLAPMTTKTYPKTKKILGYDCFKFEAQSKSKGKKIKIVGWATNQIQTSIRPIMEEALIKVGFPLEMTFTGDAKSNMVFRAVSILNETDPAVFVVPIEK